MRNTFRSPQTQKGLVLFIALIVLVAMSLAGIGMMRSVETTGAAANNIAMRQAAMHAGDRGIRHAMTWLTANADGPAAYTDNGAGYYAAQFEPPSGTTWADFFNDATNRRVTVPADPSDSSGYTVEYVIHRLCTRGGSPDDINLTPPISCAGRVTSKLNQQRGNSTSGGEDPPPPPPFNGFRVTIKVAGSKNTTAFIQGYLY